MRDNNSNKKGDKPEETNEYVELEDWEDSSDEYEEAEVKKRNATIISILLGSVACIAKYDNIGYKQAKNLDQCHSIYLQNY